MVRIYNLPSFWGKWWNISGRFQCWERISCFKSFTKLNKNKVASSLEKGGRLRYETWRNYLSCFVRNFCSHNFFTNTTKVFAPLHTDIFQLNILRTKIYMKKLEVETFILGNHMEGNFSQEHFKTSYFQSFYFYLVFTVVQ